MGCPSNVALEQRHETLTRMLAMPAPPTLHPSMAEIYRQQVAALSDGLRLDIDDTARERIRALIDHIDVNADGAMLVHGNLAAMLAMAQGRKHAAEDGLDRMMSFLRHR